MKKFFLYLVFCISILEILTCQYKKKTNSEFNLDFENIENGFPRGWKYKSNSFKSIFSIDSIVIKKGKYSAHIEVSNSNYQNETGLLFILPNNYYGKKISLSGYIKTENITEGYAGLWIQTNPAISQNKIQQNKITGTTDWKKYKITLDMHPDQTEQIIIGGILF